MSRLEEAAAALASGEIVGVPTDTVYGLAVDPWNEQAVSALYDAKGRPEHKPIGLLAASLQQVEEIGELSGCRPLAEEHWPGALTLVVRPKVLIPDWVGDKAMGTVGIRVPDHDLLRSLLKVTGPLAVTSANVSGGAETLDHEQAEAQFGSRVAVYLRGRCPGQMASTVVDATGDELQLLRAGPVVISRGL